MNPFILALQARNLTMEIHHHSAYQIVLSNDTPFYFGYQWHTVRKDSRFSKNFKSQKPLNTSV